jgi:hypothetical protein
MCILLQFPSPDDPRPEPPVPSVRLSQPAEPAVSDAISVRALPLQGRALPPAVSLRVIAYRNRSKCLNLAREL